MGAPAPAYGWPMDDPGEGQGAGRRLSRPRWMVSLRALVVVLAMLAAALGMLWLEAAGVEGVSAEYAGMESSKVSVPSLGTQLPGSDSGTPSVAARKPAGPSKPAGASKPAGPTNPAGPSKPAGAAADQLDGMLLVHIAGAVKSPGVYVLDSGSRVYQGVEAAGGALPEAQLSALNLAAPLDDGTQIFVPTTAEAAQAPAGAGTGAQDSGQGGAGDLININTATAAELDALPGVGPVLAARIVDWRTEHGSFPTVDALDAVSGIGTKLLGNIRELVRVS